MLQVIFLTNLLYIPDKSTFTTITRKELYFSIDLLDDSKAPGCEQLSAFMIKSCKWKIARIYNCSEPLVGEELYTQMGFFLFRQFWPIDMFIIES